MGLYKEIYYHLRVGGSLLSDGRTYNIAPTLNNNLQQYGIQNKPLYLRSIRFLTGNVMLQDPNDSSVHRKFDVGCYDMGALDGTKIINGGYFQVNKDLLLYMQDARPRSQPMLFGFPFVDFGYNFNLRGKSLSVGDIRCYIEVLSLEWLTTNSRVVVASDSVHGNAYFTFELVLGWNEDF